MKIVILASGAGQTFQNILDHQLRSHQRWQIISVITDNPKAGVIARAKAAGLPLQIVNPKDFSDFAAWDSALYSAIQASGADTVFLFGFLRRMGPLALTSCHGKIYNVHPSLLPRHGGKGMYGRRVHEAVITAKDLQTGVTIHRVNANYDEGQVLKRAFVKVLPGDTAEKLEERVKAVEVQSIIEFLNSF
jgi:phosphoribosylglycinamide formyltransferase 1